ncbi:hypothetical protein ACFOZY_10415 [Chungangia koreensis]|uniref:Uncharacterized protein n=1 Tax=Chungangia koreensis TaxID=752657 RepID=A0ABV8X4H4_9LACT
MKKRVTRRFFAIIMIGFMLFWTAMPSLGMAAFMTYGTPIQYGTPITGVKPMTGGEFMVPGNVYDYGNPVSGGQPGSTGQIIIPQNPSANGQFILPNIINSPKYNFLITGNAMDPGNVMTPGEVSGGGDAVNAGDASSNGNAGEGGNPAQNGEALNGGDASGGGNTANGGDPAEGGSALDGGDPSSSGDAVSAGNTTNGNTISGGDGSNNGEITPGEAGDGNALDGGTPGEGGTSPEGNSPDGVNPLNPNDGAPGGSGQDSSGPTGNGGGGDATNPSTDQTPLQGFFKTLKDGKRYFVTYKNHLANMLDGTLSIMAGFKLTDLNTASGKKNLWRISGDPTAVKGSGKLSTWLNMRYSDYLNSFENSKAVVKGKGGGVAEIGKDGKKTTRNWSIFAPRDGQDLKQKRIQGFLDEIGPKSIWNKSKDYMKKNWIPTNKDFFGKTALAKGNGIANIFLSVGSRLAENAADPSRTGTDLAAGITTDVLLGAGQTAVSAAAGWGASVATAAAVGSVVPGVGTVVGAAVGFGLAWFMSTETGKGISRRVEGVVKAGINKAKDFGKGIVNGLKGLFGG